jgi:hypothetical protein
VAARLSDGWWHQKTNGLWCSIKGHPATWLTHDTCAAMGYYNQSVTGPCEQWCTRCHKTLRYGYECLRGGATA